MTVGDDDPDPNLIALLAMLWQRSTGPRAAALAALGKQCGLPMSSVRRHLLALEDAGLARTEVEPGGRATACLTPEGEQLCRELFGALPDNPGP